MKKSISLFLLAVSSLIAQQVKTTEYLNAELNQVAKNQQVKIWIYFTDKGNSVSSYLKHPELVVSKKSLQRRKKVMNKNALIDFRDIPVSNTYVHKLSTFNIKIHHQYICMDSESKKRIGKQKSHKKKKNNFLWKQLCLNTEIIQD